MKLRRVLLILLVMIFLSACSSNNIPTKMSLTIYGTSENIQTYNVEDSEVIKDLINMINEITVEDNLVSQRDGFDLPKGASYELEYTDNQSKEYHFIGEYLVYENNVYDVKEYQTVINTLKDKFNCK